MNQLQDVLDQLDSERGALLAIVAGLDEAALDRKGLAGEWSIKNVLAHIAAWEAWVIEMLQARLTTGAVPEHLRAAAADENAFNAEQVAEREELTPDEQLIELERTRNTLVEYLRTVDETTFSQRPAWPGWDGSLAEYLLAAVRDHDAEHRQTLSQVVAGLRDA